MCYASSKHRNAASSPCRRSCDNFGPKGALPERPRSSVRARLSRTSASTVNTVASSAQSGVCGASAKGGCVRMVMARIDRHVWSGNIRSALLTRIVAAENLFLCRQLAMYMERGVKPRRPDLATRVSLALLSGLLDWRTSLEAFGIVNYG